MSHNFAESLAASHAAEDLPLWSEVYHKAFPTLAAIINHRQDGDHQRQGIDRSLILANSKQILIDEKVRWRNKKTGLVYDDIALEYLSDRDRGIPGWVCKPLLCDYIAYAIAPIGKCYLLPVLQLQQAWSNRSGEWLETYKKIEAENKSPNGNKWVTLSVGVPVNVVFKEIGGCLRLEFNAVDMCEAAA